MQDFKKNAKNKLFLYRNLTSKLQKAAIKSSNATLNTALNDFKESLEFACNSINIYEGINAPLWWMDLKTGEITNNHLEKLEMDYANFANLIIKEEGSK